ncbi:MAG: hypothetical protein MJZ49_08010 [Bacteroidales bacterium]|nr:hypothetical protein [Bacteroidales bacterium]
MKRNILAISLLLMAILFTGCHKGIELTGSDKVNQDNIFQQYATVYDADAQKMTAIATFRLDQPSGKLLRLVSGSKVEVAGQKMEMNDEGKYEFSFEQFGRKTHFTYVNNNKETFNNELITNTIEFNQETIALSKSDKVTFAIKAEAFEDAETVSCQLSSDGETVEVEVAVEAGRIVVEPDFLETIQPGTYTARLIRKGYSNRVNAKARGGVWESKYISKSKKITIQ